MKKIFFIFAMMLMSVVSALAEESSVEYDLTDLSSRGYVAGYIGSRIIVEGEDGDDYGLYLSDGKKITIRSKNGEIITKVEFVIGYGEEFAERLNTTDGDVHAEDDVFEGFIDNINATSLTISSDVDDSFQIKSVVVYYEIGEDATLFDLDEYMQTETFATTTGNIYSGKNVGVTSTRSDDNGLYIGEGNTITIGPKDNKSLEILKVDLDFNSDVNGSDLFSQVAINIDGSGKSWSVSNINSSSLTLAIRNGIAQVNNIKVYYVEVSEKTVTFPTVHGEKYYENNIAVSGTESSSVNGLDIEGNSVTITSDNGVLISKVDLRLNDGSEPEKIESTAGTVAGSDKNWTISGINSSNLTISHPGEVKGRVQIKEIKVHYREVNAPSTMELTAAFAEGVYWTTFYSAIDNYQAPEDTWVFTVNLDGNTIKTTEIEDGIVTKGQGVMLMSKSSTGNIVMTKVDNGSSYSYVGNSLVGTSHSISNPGNAYVLNYKTSRGVAFYKLSSTGTIGANKAYLVANSTAAARAFFAFDTDATTGIDKVNAQNSEKEVKAFDLQGRRVAKPANGLYIVNGKKVIMK